MISVQKVLNRDGPECCWCAVYLSRGNATREHLVPKNMGGGDGAWNIAPACGWCNGNRAHRTGPPPYLRGQGQGWAAGWWRKHGELGSLVAARRDRAIPEYADVPKPKGRQRVTPKPKHKPDRRRVVKGNRCR